MKKSINQSTLTIILNGFSILALIFMGLARVFDTSIIKKVLLGLVIGLFFVNFFVLLYGNI